MLKPWGPHQRASSSGSVKASNTTGGGAGSARVSSSVRPSDGIASNRVGVVGCFLALIALISPRLVLILLWIFDNVLSRAFDSWLIPLIGFFVLPWTTLAYVAFWEWGSGHHVTGIEWFFVVLAFVIDLGSYGVGGRERAARAA